MVGKTSKFLSHAFAFVATPFMALFWALLAFYSGWVGGWSIVIESWREKK